MATQIVSVALPDQLIAAMDERARDENRSRDELLQEAARQYMRREHQWRADQLVIAERARAAGIRTEDDVEELLDSLGD